MDRIKGYFIRQASRPGMDLAADTVIFGIMFACIYFGWIH